MSTLCAAWPHVWCAYCRQVLFNAVFDLALKGLLGFVFVHFLAASEQAPARSPQTPNPKAYPTAKQKQQAPRRVLGAQQTSKPFLRLRLGGFRRVQLPPENFYRG